MPRDRGNRKTSRAGTLHRAMIVLDGLGDRANPALGGKTALEAAHTPNLDRLVSQGVLGRALPVGPGIAPESDAGVLGLLGYDPRKDSPGRGVLEAEGLGIPLHKGEIAFRCNFATVDAQGFVKDSRVGRSLTTREASRLAEALTRARLLRGEGVRCRVLATVGHRGVVLLSPRVPGKLSDEISNSDPFYTKQGGLGRALRPRHPQPRVVRPLSRSRSAQRTARLVNLLLSRIGPLLDSHPVNRRRRESGQMEANALLLRDAGRVGRGLPLFRTKWGLRGAALTEMPVERGLARLLGLRDVFVGPLKEGHKEAGLRARAQRTLELLQTFPFVYVHLKGPDEPGHDGDAQRKKDVIEMLDSCYFGPLLSGLDLAGVRVLVTADHATPCSLKGHSADPVPLILAGGPQGERAVRPLVKFSERSARLGSLGTLSGPEIMDCLIRDPRTADG